MEFIGVETLVVYTPTRDSFEVLVGRLVAMLRSALSVTMEYGGREAADETRS